MRMSQSSKSWHHPHHYERIDVIGCQLVLAIQQFHAQQAYTQSEPKGAETWIFLLSDRWPNTWESKYKSPVVTLRLALYGHPLSGASWAIHYPEKLHSVGFESVPFGSRRSPTRSSRWF